MLRLRLAGRFAIERDNVLIDDRQLGSRKARLLLKVLAARRGHTVPMEVLAGELWGDAAPLKVDANVATLVSRLRGVLGAETIVGGRGGYRLAVGPSLLIDIDEAEGLVEEAERRLAAQQPVLALTAGRRALELLARGSVLEDDPAAEVAVELERVAARLARRGRAATWRSCLLLGEDRGALATAQDAVAADPLDEEAHRAGMLAYHRLGEPGEALRAYQRLRTVLVEELGAEPGPSTEALYQAVLRGDPVTDERSEGRGPAVVEPGFVGREAELARLVQWWADASQGVASCVIVTGEAGIGKTRLVSELAATVRAAGGEVLEARCYELERSLFIEPIVEVLRAAVGRLPQDVLRRAAAERAGPLVALVPEIDRVLGPSGYQPASAEIERRRSFEAVAGFLTGLARQRPLLVTLDDLHEAGSSTVELLHFVLRWDRSAPLLVVGTARSDAAEGLEPLGSLSQTVELDPLSGRAVSVLAGQAGLGDHADRVLAMTGGHTLFVIEALRALVEDGGSAVEGLRVPESLRSAIATRLRRCGPEVEELLRAAVVVGSSFEVAHVADLLGLSGEEVVYRAELARRARLLRASGPHYEFANDLIREAIYLSTPESLRMLRHHRLATLLAERPEAAAEHASAAGDWRTAVTRWVEAAARAAAAFSNREADQLLTRALTAAVLVDDPALTAEVQLARGQARLSAGHYASASEDLTSAQQLARATGAHTTEAAALAELGWSAYHARDIRRAHELADRAAAHPEAGPRARILVGRVRNADGDVEGAIAVLDPVSVSEPDGAARALALSCLGTALAHGDRFHEAVRTLEDAVLACSRDGVLRGLLNARMFGAMSYANLGDFGRALVWSDNLLSDVQRYEAAFYHPRALNTLAWIWRELGDPGRARDLAEEALDRSVGDDGEVEGEPAANALLALAESALISGDESDAMRRLGEIAPLVSDRVGFRWRIELRRLELAARMEPGRAEELLHLARRSGSAKYEALALGSLGAAEEAVAAARRTGSPWLLARVAPEALARASAAEVARALPEGLRPRFLAHGLVNRRWTARS